MTPTKKLTTADAEDYRSFTDARRRAHLDLFRIIDASLTKSYADYPDHPFDLALANAITPIFVDMPYELVLELREFFRVRFLKS